AGRIRQRFGGRVRIVLWSTPSDAAWVDEVSGHDAIVNLAGAQAVGTRFTVGRKQEIRNSRVKNTRDLVDALSRARVRPSRLISGSAVGYYGPLSPGTEVDETSLGGAGFLAELCHEWEQSALAAEALGVSVALARLGVVLGQGGGALEVMTRPFRLGIGGWIGSGRQDVSFISLSDAVRALRFCIDQPALRGPVNLTTPHPTTAKEMAKKIGGTLHMPNWLPVPALALRALFGEGADSLLTGQRVLPRVLERLGFEWCHPTIELALKSALAPDARVDAV
ncbi:MAG TPA: TIGR01777 family oxidoreductase, partial [Polyangiaceae bacterium]|nr:TIGR01777 family oxidoreductase [Polyangiaceae bacterium]